MKRLLIASTLAALCCSPALAASNLVLNGGFETLNNGVSVSAGSFVTVYAGQDTIADWAVGGNSIDVINGGWGAISGNSIDMLGSPGPGSLSQTISTTAGQTYQLSFDLSDNPGGGNGSQANPNALFVAINGGPATEYLGQYPGYQSISQEFVATGSATTLTFTSAASGYSGSVLDNVAVSAVPETGSVALWAAGLCALGFLGSRRRQSL